MPQHAIAQVAQIGGAGPEIGIFGRIVGGDFRIDRGTPRPFGGFAIGDQRKRRRHQTVVFEQRNLEGEIASASASPTSRASAARSRLGRRKRIDKGLMLLRWRPR